MKEFIKIFAVVAALLFPLVATAAPITKVRSSVSPARVRLVLDSADEIAYKVKPQGKLLKIELPESTSKKQHVNIKDEFIRNVNLFPVEDGSQLNIRMTQECQYKIYRLTNPHRLVIDIFRINLVREEKQLAKGVKYTYLQDEMNGKQMQACVLEIAPNAKYELRPFSAAGAQNGRGLLSKETQRRGLKAAVNASYFDKDGWVIGVTKDNGKFMSMDSQPRSAYVDDGKERFIVEDVAYHGSLRLDNGYTMQIKGMNRERIGEDIVLFNEYYGASTKTNHWGRELKIYKNRVIEVSNFGNMRIDKDCDIISAHGINKDILMQVKIGDKVELKQGLNVAEADAAKIVVGAGPRILKDGKVHVRSVQENIPKDIAKGRAPRTAIGLKRDGTVIVLVVDGRSRTSGGLTLDELATYFLRLGARDAINLDGGGSSVMVINGKIVNQPSDGKERAISMGLGLFPKN